MVWLPKVVEHLHLMDLFSARNQSISVSEMLDKSRVKDLLHKSNNDQVWTGLDFIIIKSGLSLIQNISCKIIHISDKFIRNVKSKIYRLPMNLHNHHLYLLEQHRKSLKIIRSSNNLLVKHEDCLKLARTETGSYLAGSLGSIWPRRNLHSKQIWLSSEIK